jgi:hypothetical protein
MDQKAHQDMTATTPIGSETARTAHTLAALQLDARERVREAVRAKAKVRIEPVPSDGERLSLKPLPQNQPTADRL